MGWFLSGPVVGWCVGQVVERNTDGRSFKTIDGERVKVNFLIFYEIDQQTVKTVLRLDDYDSEWVLLASDAAVPIEPGPREAHTLADRPRSTWTRDM